MKILPPGGSNLAAGGEACGNGLVDVPGTIAVADVVDVVSGTVKCGALLRNCGHAAGEHHQIRRNKLLLAMLIHVGHALGGHGDVFLNVPGIVKAL